MLLTVSVMPGTKRRYGALSRRFAGARFVGSAVYRGARMAARAWRRSGGRGGILKRIRGAPRRWVRRVRRAFGGRRVGRAGRIPYQPGPGNELTVTSRKYRLKRFKLRSVVNTNRNRTILRLQGLTNFDTNSGYHPLINWRNPATDEQVPPVHLYDLTHVPNNTATINGGYYFKVAGASSTDAVSTPTVLSFQNPDGASIPFWQWEKGTAVAHKADSFFHEWTQVKLNLYGARKRTTYFDVMFVRFPDDLANLLSANPSNPHHKQLMHQIMRPLMYSNLYTFRPEAKRMMTVVKRFRYYVPATQSIDLNTTTGKIRQVNIFLRHNRRYQLDWVESQTIPPVSGADVVDFANMRDQDNRNFPKEHLRLYMLVCAFAPEQRSGVGAYPDAIDPAIDPSYDIIIRNAFSMNRAP